MLNMELNSVDIRVGLEVPLDSSWIMTVIASQRNGERESVCETRSSCVLASFIRHYHSLLYCSRWVLGGGRNNELLKSCVE